MNKLVKKGISTVNVKEISEFLNKTGKPGCVLIAFCYTAYLVRDLCSEVMDKGASVEVSATTEKGISLKLNSNPKVA